jgi:hypothetical protein
MLPYSNMSKEVDNYDRKISNIKENKTYKSSVKRAEIIRKIVTDLQRAGGKIDKNDQGVICRACILIENLVKKKYHLVKFDILIDILKEVTGVNLTPADVEVIRRVVQFCLDSKLVKKVGVSVRVFSYVRNVFIHNFLFR